MKVTKAKGLNTIRPDVCGQGSAGEGQRQRGLGAVLLGDPRYPLKPVSPERLAAGQLLSAVLLGDQQYPLSCL